MIKRATDPTSNQNMGAGFFVYSNAFCAQKAVYGTRDCVVTNQEGHLVNPMNEPVWRTATPLFTVKTGEWFDKEQQVKELSMRDAITEPFTKLVKVLDYVRKHATGNDSEKFSF